MINDMNNIKKLETLGIEIKGKTSGNIKTKCPKCSHKRKHKNDPCLSVNIDEGLFKCHNCGYKGSVAGKTYVLPEYKQELFEDNSYNKAVEYLVEKRGIPEHIVRKHKVTYEPSYFYPGAKKSKDGIGFNYFKNGVLVNKKFRSFDKDFAMVSGAELVFYNMNNITLNTDYLVITEGEIDAMSFDAAGYSNVVSVPNGANKNFDYFKSAYEVIKKFNKIYIAVDGDDAGKSIIDELARRIGKEKCLLINYPVGCKDANQVLLDYGVSGVKNLINNAKYYPIDGIILANDVKDGLFNLYDKGFDKGKQVNVFGGLFDNMLSFREPFLYTFTGIPAHGKSSIVNYIEVLLAAKHGWKFAVFSPEHYPVETLLYRYAELLIGKPFLNQYSSNRMSKTELNSAINFINEHFYIIRPTDENFTIDKILELAKSLVFRFGVNSITIDPYNMIDHDFSTSETQYVEKLLNRLQRFRHAHNVAMFLVAHPRKMNKDSEGLYEVPNLYDISGSSNFFNKTDFGISVYRNMKSGRTEIYVQKVKYKSMGSVGKIELEYNMATSRFDSITSKFEEPLIDLGNNQETINFYNYEEENEEFIIPDEDLPF